jgi:hypothetical protein
MEFVDQSVLHHGGVKGPVSVLEEVPAGVALKVVDERGDVAVDRGGIPAQIGGRGRRNKFRDAVHPVDEVERLSCGPRPWRASRLLARLVCPRC